MKKLMFAAAAIAAGVAMADVTSANIVGYVNKDAPSSGNKVFGPCFGEVAGGKVKLSDIKVTGYDPYDPDEEEGGANGEVSIQFLDKYGSVDVDGDGNDKWYKWYDLGEEKAAGWYNRTGKIKVEAEAIEFDPAQGVWTAGKAGFDIVFAGQVIDSNVKIAAPQSGNILLANPMAVTLDLSGVWVADYDPYDPDEEEGGANGEVSIQFLDKYGSVDVDGDGNDKWYKWYDLGEEKAAGWYNRTGKVAIDAKTVTLNPGEGVWTAGKAGFNIYFKAPEL